MEIRNASHPEDVKKYDTQRLRKEFLVQNLMERGKLNLFYTHFDRFILGGCVPENPIHLQSYPILRADYFLERREMGVINTGGTGVITADGKDFELTNKSGVYIGKETRDVVFKSVDSANPAKFYIASAPAHAKLPTQLITMDKAEPFHTGAAETCNERTVYKFIHAKGAQSCQLVMGLTMFKPGNIWNTMPPHVHDRRMEAYFYFDLQQNSKVFHFMGEPEESRHIVVGNEEGIISPPWSMHFGAGTSNYSFIWAMAGENRDYTDMDAVNLEQVK